MSDIPVLAADDLGLRYRRGWALQHCSFQLPPGRITALVGPNGAGKSTLFRLATGFLRPTTGSIRVLGEAPMGAGVPTGLAFLSQEKPLYRGFTVAEMLRAGARLNRDWDQQYAQKLVRQANVPMDARIKTLSGGQATRVALAVALGRRPQLLILDEPLADLDPLARTEVMQTLMSEVAELGISVLLSSHVLSDLEDVCDHLLIMREGAVRLAGDVEDVIASHQLLVGPADADPGLAPSEVVETRKSGRGITILARARNTNTAFETHTPSLEELVLSYLRTPTLPTTPVTPARKAVAA